ncbi:MAG: N-acetylmuramoyl-L-alanine amidase [Filimonas sp.]|nr:N-acetylmuramoyl-L-alanine amidase [Filimonas sp.]
MKKILQTSLVLVASLAVLYGCSHGPYATTNKMYKTQAKDIAKTIGATPVPNNFDSVPAAAQWVGTTNFNMRKPNFVIIHHTAQNSCEQTLKTFTVTHSQVSAHYVICKDGTVHHMLNDYLRAWQAGNSRWGNVTDINSVSIGIEIDNNGFEKFTDEQINSLLHLLSGLKKSYGIPAANFIGHADIAPTRKNDPNVTFPWKTLADKGFGLWYNDTTNVAVPENFNSIEALRIVGYDVRDTSATIRSFKRHFMQQDTSKVLNEEDKKVLFQLYRKYMQ